MIQTRVHYSKPISREIAIGAITVLLGGSVFGFITYEKRDVLAAFVWETFRWGDVALLIHETPLLASQVGDYYFNVHGSGVYDLKKARQYYLRALEVAPSMGKALYQLGRIDFLGGEFLGALDKFDAYLLTHDQSHVLYHRVMYMKALTLGYMGLFGQSTEEFLKLIELKKEILIEEGTIWAPYTDLAWAYFSMGDYEHALRYAREGLDYTPNNPWLLNMYGIALLNTGNKEKAREVLSEALKGAEELSEDDWHRAYPGNDPRLARPGLVEIVQSIKTNLALTSPE